MKINRNPELMRAAYHFSTVAGVIALSYLVPYSIGKYLLGGAVILFILFEICRLFIPWFHKYANEKLLSWYLRPHEKNGRSANIDCVLGIAFAYFIFPMHIFRAVILIVAVADPMARIIGRIYGKTYIPWIFDHKTWIGSGAFLVSAFACALVYIAPMTALVAAVVATITEAWPDIPHWLNDNFNTPVIAGTVILIIENGLI